MSGSILVVAPHPLDEILGCGGAIQRDVSQGARVSTLFLCGGQTERHARLKAAAISCARLLGTDEPAFCNFPENRSDTIPLLEIVTAIERHAASRRPDMVYVCHGGNLNIDHQRAFQAVLTAFRPVPGAPLTTLLAYEVQSSTDWAAPATPSSFQPNWFVDIGAVLELKLQALSFYGTEMRDPPHARSIDSARALATSRGATIGAKAAEAFMLVRHIARS